MTRREETTMRHSDDELQAWREWAERVVGTTGRASASDLRGEIERRLRGTTMEFYFAATRSAAAWVGMRVSRDEVPVGGVIRKAHGDLVLRFTTAEGHYVYEASSVTPRYPDVGWVSRSPSPWPWSRLRVDSADDKVEIVAIGIDVSGTTEQRIARCKEALRGDRRFCGAPPSDAACPAVTAPAPAPALPIQITNIAAVPVGGVVLRKATGCLLIRSSASDGHYVYDGDYSPPQWRKTDRAISTWAWSVTKGWSDELKAGGFELVATEIDVSGTAHDRVARVQERLRGDSRYVHLFTPLLPRAMRRQNVPVGAVVREWVRAANGSREFVSGGFAIVYEQSDDRKVLKFAHYVRGGPTGDGPWLRSDLRGTAPWATQVLYTDARDEVDVIALDVDVSGSTVDRIERAKKAIRDAGIPEPV